jgi:ElaB/YqjD/DUF883 family membrane-anchored ribosome-binding protein
MAQGAPHGDGRPDLKEKPAKEYKKVADRVEGLAGAASEQAAEAAERAREVAGNVRRAVDKSVKDQPMATLALAAMAGFVLGALWKS